MTRSPNDIDPPDMEGPLEAFYELIYEKYPWVEDLTDSDYEAWPHEEIQKNFEGFLKFVINHSYTTGVEESGVAIGEQIDGLLAKQAELEKALVAAEEFQRRHNMH